MVHVVKGFIVVSEADVFLEFSCFFYDPVDVGSLISGSSAFSKSSLNLEVFSSRTPWRILSITLLVCEISPFVW